MKTIAAWVLLLSASVGAAVSVCHGQSGQPAPPRDRFGEPLPQGAIARLGTVRQRAVAARLGLSADGKTIVTVAGGRLVKIWEADTGELRESRELPLQTGQPAFLSPDGRLLAVRELGANTPLDIWDAIAGKRLHRLPQQGGIYRAAFAPDGKQLAISQSGAAKDSAVILWDLTSVKQRDLKGTARAPENLAFSPDGKMFAATDGRKVFCWNCSTGEQLWQQNSAFGSTLAFMPNSRTLIASAGSREPAWHAWDAATGKPDKELKLPEGYPYADFAVAPDGRTLVLSQRPSVRAADHRVRLWDLQSGKLLHTLKAEGPIGPFFPDGKSFLTNDGALQRWNLATGQALLPDTDDLGHRSEVYNAVYSPGGRRLASAARDGTIRLWAVATAKPLQILRGHEAFALTFTPDGKLLISGSASEGELHIWDAQTGSMVRRIALYERERASLEQAVVKLQLTPDGQTIFVLRYKNTDGRNPGEFKAILSSWDLATGQRKTQAEVGPCDGLYSAFSPDGQILVSNGELVDTATGKARVKLEGGARLFAHYAFAPIGRSVAGIITHMEMEGQRITTKMDGIQIWEAVTGRKLHRISTDFVGKLAFSPDGRYLAAGDMQGLRLWEMDTGEVVMRHKAHESIRGFYSGSSFASCLIFAPDGRSLATGHVDSTVLIWDLASTVRPATAKELPRLWKDLIASDAAQAYVASWRLADAPTQTIPFLRERLRPVSAASVEQVRSLLTNLDSEDFAKREAAASRLRELGERAASFLREELKAKPSLEKRRRVEELLKDLEKPPSGERLGTLRAIAVLARIGTAEARQILETLAQGMRQARVTREAKASLERLTPHHPEEKR